MAQQPHSLPSFLRFTSCARHPAPSPPRQGTPSDTWVLPDFLSLERPTCRLGRRRPERASLGAFCGPEGCLYLHERCCRVPPVRVSAYPLPCPSDMPLLWLNTGARRPRSRARFARRPPLAGKRGRQPTGPLPGGSAKPCWGDRAGMPLAAVATPKHGKDAARRSRTSSTAPITR